MADRRAVGRRVAYCRVRHQRLVPLICHVHFSGTRRWGGILVGGVENMLGELTYRITCPMLVCVLQNQDAGPRDQSFLDLRR